jgi:excisionase family DNA binding protein
LVARSLETRWETKLRELAEAEAELAEQTKPAPDPSREQLEALARDVPALWAADTTSEKDRKRLVRAVITDVTITSQPQGRDVAVGIRWRTGAAEQHTIQRPPSINDITRTPPAIVELITRLSHDHTNTEIAAELNATGIRTGKGLRFDASAVRHIRRAHNIPTTRLPHDDRLTVDQAAERLGISPGVIYNWISRGKLAADRDRANRLRIAFDPDAEQECRERIANSSHIRQTRIAATGGAV